MEKGTDSPKPQVNMELRKTECIFSCLILEFFEITISCCIAFHKKSIIHPHSGLKELSNDVSNIEIGQL